MCKLATQTNKLLMVSEYEVSNPNWSTTLKVIRHLKGQLQSHLKCDTVEVWLVCGADLLESFAKPGVWADEDVCEKAIHFLF
jgi:nicotinamide mononucleotide adenylyltransferase